MKREMGEDAIRKVSEIRITEKVGETSIMEGSLV